MLAVTISRLLSLSRSARTIAVGFEFPSVEYISMKVKVPLPCPRKTMAMSLSSATARSTFLSLLMSPTATETGAMPTTVKWATMGANVPSPFPIKTPMVFVFVLAETISNRLSLLTSATATHCGLEPIPVK